MASGKLEGIVAACQWVGLLYDDIALDAAWELVKDWSAEERQAMRDSVPRQGFATPFRGRSVRDLAREMLEISAAGLRRRAVGEGTGLDAAGMSEEGFLNPLRVLVERGQTRADELLRRYREDWKGDIAPLFREYNFL